MKNFKKLAGRVIALAAVCVLAFGLTACGSNKKKVTIEVTDNTGNTSTYNVKTDAEYLIYAIEDAKGLTIDGEENEWGYYLTTVNGVEANYDVDASYWSIYVNGEYGMYGIDQQPVNDGDTFSLVYEIYDGEGVG